MASIDFGLGFWALLLLALAAKAVRAARRVGTNRKAACGLGGVLASCLLFVLGGWIGARWGGTTVLGVALAVVAGLGGSIGLISSAFLALLGVREMRHSPARWERGRGQAWAALAVTSSIVFIAGATLVAALSDSIVEPSTSPPQHSFASLNFRLAAAPADWTAEKASNGAVLTFRRSKPDARFSVLAEDAGPDAADLSNEALAGLSRSNLFGAASQVVEISRAPTTLDQLPALEIVSHAVVDGRSRVYLHTVLSHHGFLYQLVGWAPRGPEDLASLRAGLAPLLAGFSLIDHDRLGSQAAPGAPYGTVDSARYGYRIDLAGTRWRHWSDLAKSWPGADSGGLYGPGAAFVTLSLPLGDLDPDDELLARAFAQRFGQPAVAHATVPFEATAAPEGASALGRDVEHQAYRYRLRVLRRGGLAHLVASWAVIGIPDDVLDAPTNAFQFMASPPTVDPDPVPGAELAMQGSLLNDLGLEESNRGAYEAAVRSLTAAVERRPDDGQIVENLVDVLTLARRYEDVLVTVAAHEKRFADRLSMLSYRPYAEWQLGRREAAASHYGALFARGYRHEHDLSDYVDLLNELGRTEHAATRVAEYRRHGDSPLAARLAAHVERVRGQPMASLAILRQAAAQLPFDQELTDELINELVGAGLGVQALAHLRGAIAHGHDTLEMRLLEGHTAMALERYDEARSAFTSAAAHDLSSQDAAHALERLRGILGEGDSSLVSEEIAAVAVPDDLWLRAPAVADVLAARRGSEPSGDSPAVAPAARSVEAPPAVAAGKPGRGGGGDSELPGPGSLAEAAAADSEADAIYLARVTAVRFRPGSDYRVTDYRRVRILDREGAEIFNAFRFDFDPARERLFVNSLRVLDPDGRERAQAQRSDSYVVDAGDADGASQEKTLVVPVPGLEPHSTIELVVTRGNLAPPDALPFVRYRFSSWHPVRNAALVLDAEANGVSHVASAMPQAQKRGNLMVWRLASVPAFRSEPFGDDVGTYLPQVAVGASDVTWASAGKSYLADIAERLVTPSEVERLAAELIRGRTDNESKATALAAWVQSNVSYRAIAFGRRAWLPSPTAEILHRRYGDCKDHALLLAQLFAAADLPAQLALVSVREDVIPALPSLDQFDHMVVYAPWLRGGHFFDPTDKDHDITLLPPVGLGGSAALILDPGTARLANIPDYDAESSTVEIRRRVTVLVGGDARVSERVVATGLHGAFLRGSLRGLDRSERHEWLRRQLAGDLDLQVVAVETQAVEEPTAPLRLDLDYLVRRAFHPADDGLAGQVPSLFENSMLLADAVSTRQSPFRIRYPLRIVSRVELTGPAGFRGRWQQSATARENERGRGPFHAWSTTRTPEPGAGDSLVLEWTAMRLAGRHPASGYEAFRESTARALGALGQSVVVSRVAVP